MLDLSLFYLQRQLSSMGTPLPSSSSLDSSKLICKDQIHFFQHKLAIKMRSLFWVGVVYSALLVSAPFPVSITTLSLVFSLLFWFASLACSPSSSMRFIQHGLQLSLSCWHGGAFTFRTWLLESSATRWDVDAPGIHLGTKFNRVNWECCFSKIVFIKFCTNIYPMFSLDVKALNRRNVTMMLCCSWFLSWRMQLQVLNRLAFACLAQNLIIWS